MDVKAAANIIRLVKIHLRYIYIYIIQRLDGCDWANKHITWFWPNFKSWSHVGGGFYDCLCHVKSTNPTTRKSWERDFPLFVRLSRPIKEWMTGMQVANLEIKYRKKKYGFSVGCQRILFLIFRHFLCLFIGSFLQQKKWPRFEAKVPKSPSKRA